jgi:hypothetical protein
MAISRIPPNTLDASTLICAICSVQLTLDKATAGLLDRKGRQTFACVSHFSEVEKLISGWADFMATERYKYLREAQEPQVLIYGADRLARFDS